MRAVVLVAERWVLDADTATPLVLPVTSRQGVARVVEQRTPPPADRLAEAPRPEGALPTVREFELRTITLKLKLERPEDQWAGVTHDFGVGAPVEAEGEGVVPGFTGTTRRANSVGNPLVPAVLDLQQAIGAWKTSGSSVCGTLTRVVESGERVTFDVVAVADDGVLWDEAMWLGHETETTIEFRCLPWGRGQELMLGSAASVAGQRLVTVDDLDVPGDVPALARFELAGATVDQSSVLYAIDQGTAPREVACSTLDRPPSATLTTVAGSVATQVVQRPAFSAPIGNGLWEPGVMLSQGGVPLGQPGQWRVIARVRGQATGRVRLRWTSGSRVSGMSTCQPVTLTSDQWELVTLGIVAVADDAGLDGVIEAALPHSQPIRYDTLLFLPVDVLGEQHATQATPPTEILAADRFLGATTTLGGSTAEVGGTWGSEGFPPSMSRTGSGSGGAAYRTASYSVSGGRSHGLALGSPVGVRATTVVVASSGTWGQGDAGVWIGNTLGEQAIAGSSGATMAAGSGAAGAWGVYVAVRPAEEAGYRWTMMLVSGTTVTSTTSGIVGAPEGLVNLTVVGTRATCEISGGSGVIWTGSLTTPVLPASLRSGLATHGWTVNAAAGIVQWWRFDVVSVPAVLDAALVTGRTARHATGGASRVDSAGTRGPVVPEGARPVLPASGWAGRRTRVAVMATRGDLRQQVDAGPTDPLTVDVFATPRWLQVPDS